jgi:hypothetical protein
MSVVIGFMDSMTHTILSQQINENKRNLKDRKILSSSLALHQLDHISLPREQHSTRYHCLNYYYTCCKVHQKFEQSMPAKLPPVV